MELLCILIMGVVTQLLYALPKSELYVKNSDCGTCLVVSASVSGTVNTEDMGSIPCPGTKISSAFRA